MSEVNYLDLIAEMPGYTLLVDALLDIWDIAHDPVVERRIVELFGDDMLHRLIDRRGDDDTDDR